MKENSHDEDRGWHTLSNADHDDNVDDADDDDAGDNYDYDDDDMNMW